MSKLFAAILLIIATVSVTLLVTREDAVAPDATVQQADQTTKTEETDSSSGKKLDYSGRGLNDFPEEIFNNTDTTELDISGNSLDGALPSQIQKLSNLEVLNVSNNNMTGIPAEIGQLSSLRVLNYADNDITGLPNELGNLSNLEVFDLRGNNPSQQDLEGIRAQLPSSVNIIL